MIPVPSSIRRQTTATALLAAALLATPLTATHAQSGTVTFGGVTNSNGALPTATYSGPALTFSSLVRTGFGNSAVAGTADGRWWTGAYSGQGMLYGNNSTLGNVLEVTLNAGSGFNLFLGGALFGAWPNASRYVTYRLFNDDFSQSTNAFTVLAGTSAPAIASFTGNNWGSVVRLQFTETNALGVNIGRGSFDVGVQGISYTVTPADPSPPNVPEPSTVLLMAAGMFGLAVTARRRTRHTTT